MQYTETRGADYGGWRRAAEIARRVRQDLKAAQAQFPPHIAFRVTSHTYTGGQMVRVLVTGLRDTELWVDPAATPNRTRSQTAQTLQQQVEEIGGAYNLVRSSTDPDDYGTTMYDLAVELETPQAADLRTRSHLIDGDRRVLRAKVVAAAGLGAGEITTRQAGYGQPGDHAIAQVDYYRNGTRDTAKKITAARPRLQQDGYTLTWTDTVHGPIGVTVHAPTRP